MGKTLKFGILLLVFLCLVLFMITIFDLSDIQNAFGFVFPTPEAPVTETADTDLVTAVYTALEQSSDPSQPYTYQIDHLEVQDDGQMALIWLAAVDPDSGRIIEREPELALGDLDPDGSWKVLLEDDAEFEEKFTQFQDMGKSIQGDVLSDQDIGPKATKVYGGYYLPWAAGLEKRLTWSIAHTSCSYDYCYYAFDFADGTMFPLVAAKGGTVYHWRDTCANGDSSCTNSITLEDRSTTPWTYQIYLHIAQNSVPGHLKQIGTPVMQGQYIADVDDTGYSTGHHLHFMVVTADTVYTSTKGYVFGRSVDVTFKDVDINWDAATQGGRPRLKYEADQYGGEGRTYYTSGNQPANPPTGALTAPATKLFITEPLLTVSGWGEDDIAVTKMEILANYNGSWAQIGTAQTNNPFTTTVDLCSTTIPDGPFLLALRVWDYEGNPSRPLTVRKLVKDTDCDTSGGDPDVTLKLNSGSLALPQNGVISATATKGTSGSTIASVEFWFHGKDWNQGNWVYLGKDTNGSDGWTTTINTETMTEASNYGIVAVVTDSAGKKAVDVKFDAVVDKTAPWVNLNMVPSPVVGNVLNLTWTGGDNLSGVDYYSLDVNVNDLGLVTLEDRISGDQTSFELPVEAGQLVIIKLTIFDKSGNSKSQRIAAFTNGYVFDHSFVFPVFFFEN